MYIRDCKTKVCLSILFRIILKKEEIKLNILNWPIKINTIVLYLNVSLSTCKSNETLRLISVNNFETYISR